MLARGQRECHRGPLYASSPSHVPTRGRCQQSGNIVGAGRGAGGFPPPLDMGVLWDAAKGKSVSCPHTMVPKPGLVTATAV